MLVPLVAFGAEKPFWPVCSQWSCSQSIISPEWDNTLYVRLASVRQ